MYKKKWTQIALVCGALAPMGLIGCTKDEVSTTSNEPVQTAPTRTVVTTPAAKPMIKTKEETKITHTDPQGDNSKRNREDEATVGTAEDQSNTKSDVDTTRDIRRSLTEDDALSVYAHNVKIITQDGHVVLKGPVRTAAEKTTVERRAREIAGATAVKSELVVTPR